MSENRGALPSKLAKARQQLQKAQARVAELEAQSFEDLDAPATLLESERRYHHILDNLLEGAEVIGFDWHYLYVNDASASHGRQSKEVLLRSTVIELYPGIENTEMFALLRTCMEERIPQHFEIDFVFPDGTTTWFELSVQPVPEGIFVLSLDITERKRTEIALMRYAQRMEILHEIDLGLIQGGSIQTLLEITLKHLRRLIPCQRANVGLIDPITGEGIMFAVDLDGSTELGQGVRFPVLPLAFEGLDARHIRVFDDFRPLQESIPRMKQLVSEGMVSGLTAAFMDQGRPIGALGLGANTPGFFNAEYQEIAAEIASQLAIAIRQKRLSEDLTQRTNELERNNADLKATGSALKRYAQRMEILHQIDLGLIQGGSIEALIEVVLKHIRQLIPCQRVSASLIDETKDEIQVFAVDLSRPSAVDKGIRVALPSGWMDGFDADHAKIINDIRLLENLIPAQKQLLKEGLVTFLHVVLTVQGHPIGLLALSTDTPGFFTAEYREVAVEIANQLAIAIHQMHLDEALTRHAAELEQRVIERTADLNDAKERVEAILNNSVDGILLANPDFTIRQTNTAFTRLFACETDAYFDQPFTALLHADGDDLMTTTILAGVTEEQVMTIEARARRKDGTEFDAELSIGFIKKGGFVCSIRDITERKVQERQLRYHATLQENVADAVIASDPDFRIQSWNRAAERIYGWRAEEIVGKKIEDTLNTQFASDEARQSFRREFFERGYWSGEAIQHRKDGTPFPVLGSISLIKDEQNVPFGIVSIIRDITERKARERQLRYHASLQENVSDAVIVTDMDFCIQSWNRAAERIYGLRAEEVIGKTAAEILHTEFSSSAQRERSVQHLREQGWWQGEVIQHHKDGSIRHILGSVTLIKDESGVPFSVVSVNHDITERKRAEEALDARLEEEREFQGYLKELHEITIELAQIDQLDNFYKHVVEQGLERLGIERLGLLLYDAEHSVVIGTYGTDAQGKLMAEHHLRFDPKTLTGILMRSMGRAERFAFDEHTPLFSNLEPIGFGWNAAAVLWNGEQNLGWLAADNAVHHKPASKPLLDILSLYALNIGTLLAQKKVQIALRESEGRYRLLANSVNDVIMRFGPTLETLYVSPSSRAVLGYDPQELLGPPNMALIHPDDIPAMLGLINVTLVNPGGGTINYRFRHKAGHYVWLETTGQAVISEQTGEVIEYVVSARDITKRKATEEALRESEERFRQIAENFDQILFIRSGDNQKLLYINPRYEVIWEKPREYLYENPNSFIEPVHPDDLDYVRQQFMAKRYVDEGFADFEYRILRSDQRLSWVRVRTFPIKNDDGAIIRRAGIIEDITERKQGEEALRESEEKFRLLLDAAPIATIISDQMGRITLVNLQAETLLGFSRAELVGQMVEILVPDYARHKHVLNRMSYMAAPRVRQMGIGLELFARRKDGSEVPVEIELSYIETTQGVMVMSFVVDITERKRVAAELEQQRSFLRNVIDVSPSMIFVKDYDARFVLVNPMVAKMYNAPVETLIGKTDADFNPSLKEVDAFLEADRRVIASGEPLYIEEPVTNLAGETHWLRTTKVPLIGADGKSKYVLGVATDITERKKSEEALRESEAKYRSLIETMSGGLSIYDVDERMTYVNDRFCELLGYSRDELIGTRPDDYADDTNVDKLASQLERRRQSESSSYEIVLRHKDGRPVHLLVSSSPLVGKNGEFNGGFAVTTDITMQKQAEETLRQALTKEKELGELKSRFVSMASHEFRTPLATILALTETLSAYRRRLTEEQIDERFDKIKDQIGHLKDIMEDVLQLARMQARRVEFNPVKLDLDSLCRSVLDEFQSRADVTQQIEYTCNTMLQSATLDKKLIRQIISNLVSNAVKYSPQAKAVKVTLEYADEVLTLAVSDEGIGIPEADLQHLFEPFHRAANVGAISGTGLGLVIAKESVELHGGTISVVSQLNVGTTFTVRIPIFARGEADNDENPRDRR